MRNRPFSGIRCSWAHAGRDTTSKPPERLIEAVWWISFACFAERRRSGDGRALRARAPTSPRSANEWATFSEACAERLPRPKVCGKARFHPVSLLLLLANHPTVKYVRSVPHRCRCHPCLRHYRSWRRPSLLPSIIPRRRFRANPVVICRAIRSAMFYASLRGRSGVHHRYSQPVSLSPCSLLRM